MRAATATNRRSQPRTVDGGRPNRSAIGRCPTPDAAATSARPITPHRVHTTQYRHIRQQHMRRRARPATTTTRAHHHRTLLATQYTLPGERPRAHAAPTARTPHHTRQQVSLDPHRVTSYDEHDASGINQQDPLVLSQEINEGSSREQDILTLSPPPTPRQARTRSPAIPAPMTPDRPYILNERVALQLATRWPGVPQSGGDVRVGSGRLAAWPPGPSSPPRHPSWRIVRPGYGQGSSRSTKARRLRSACRAFRSATSLPCGVTVVRDFIRSVRSSPVGASSPQSRCALPRVLTSAETRDA